MHATRTVVSLTLVALSFTWGRYGFGGDTEEFGPPYAVSVKAGAPFSAADELTIQEMGSSRAAAEDQAYSLFSHIDVGKKRYAIVRLEFADSASCQSALGQIDHVISSFDRFADIFMEADPQALRDLTQLPGLIWSEVDRWGVVPPPHRPEFTEERSKAPPMDIVRGGHRKLTGRGVTIAVIDTGIDFRHPDFIEYDEQGKPTSRILHFWDTFHDAYAHGTGRAAPARYPNGTPIGSIFDREDITKELRSFRPSIPVRDLDGHGTACAGIAAGNGNLNPDYRGVATRANLIAVRVGEHASLTNTFMINAICNWLDQFVGDQPLVISCSWGGQYGGRDGQGILERQLNTRFPSSRKSRAICFAAGNEGALSLHSAVRVGPKQQPGVTRFLCDGACELNFYVRTDNPDGVFVGGIGSGTLIKSVESHVNPLTHELVVQVAATIAGGLGGAYIYSDTQRGLEADVYITPNASFHPGFASQDKQLSCPGTAASVLTIGSFDWNDRFQRVDSVVNLIDPITKRPLNIGFASSYTNPGPLRTGSNIKPEIAGPGQWYTAPAPLNVSLPRDATGFYRPFNGTSAATPYVAGIIALMFEENPQLTFGEVRQRLISNVTKAESTQKQTGYGKLDRAAIERLFGRDL